MREKIGIGIVTCNRERLFFNCYQSVKDSDINKIIIVNDGIELKNLQLRSSDILITNKKNLGVGKSKNICLRYLLKQNCEHIFLLEDDIYIKNIEVFNKYIYASEISGLKHFNFAYHGPSNKDKNGSPAPRVTVPYKNEVRISLHSHLAGAFSYYHSSVLKDVGLIDERYKNYFDHLDHTVKIINKGYYSPFWWFADIADSYLFIEDQDPFLENSIIRKNKLLFKLKYKYYSYLFRKKNGYIVYEMPEVDRSKALSVLEKIRELYGK